MVECQCRWALVISSLVISDILTFSVSQALAKKFRLVRTLSFTQVSEIAQVLLGRVSTCLALYHLQGQIWMLGRSERWGVF